VVVRLEGEFNMRGLPGAAGETCANRHARGRVTQAYIFGTEFMRESTKERENGCAKR
jgi:hypothetical protein